MKLSSILDVFFRSKLSVFVSCLIITFIVFGNSLQNDFAVVDDLPGYIENPKIRTIIQSLVSLNLQETIYAINYQIVGINPLPLRILALLNHAIAGTCIFFILSHIFSKKIGYLSTILFLVHPVSTEAINWVSGQFYIVMAIFVYISLLLLIQYRKTSKKKYMIWLIVIFLLDMILIKHAWVFILPLVVITFDYFFLEKKKQQQFYRIYIGWIIPLIILFIIFNFSGQFTQRMLSRNESGKTLQNQQALTPVIQGHPYSIYSMIRLYSFPKDLTIYYDGNRITTVTHLLMYSVYILYAVAVIYFYKKDRKIAGLLIMLIVCILPVLSPKKVTWFIAERYLYAGIPFFTTLLIVELIKLEKWFKLVYLLYITFGILFILYSYRSILRNMDWKNPETLAVSTIKTSPFSVRPYNDLAGYYVLNQNYEDAKKYYVKALQVSSSLTAVRNLGHVYLEDSFDPQVSTVQYPVEQIYNEALRMIQTQEYYAAAYYLNEVLAQDQTHVGAKNRIAELYILYEKPEVAQQILLQLESNGIADADTYFILGYISFQKTEYDKSLEYLNKALELNPNHPQASQLLQQIPAN